jgi:hypothetical protein
VQKVVIQRYFWFGTVVRYLQDVIVGTPIHGDGFILGNLTEFFKKLDELNLRVTKRASYKVAQLRDDLSALPDDSKLTPEHARNLSIAMTELRETLNAELTGMEAFIISPKRIDTEKLEKDLPSLFAPSVFIALPDMAKYDFTEAAKCIIFEVPTAAGFHLMRATECVLRDFYCHFIKRDRCHPLLWGPMVQGLQSHRIAKRHDVILRNLDNIRLSFRNPTQHPDKIYDIHEVQDLWGLSVDVVNRMIRVIQGSSKHDQ